jgi:hypothetical protein
MDSPSEKARTGDLSPVLEAIAQLDLHNINHQFGGSIQKKSHRFIKMTQELLCVIGCGKI